MSAVNDVGEGELSDEIQHLAMSVPDTPQAPTIVSQAQTGPSTASATIQWNAVIKTGGVPLTGYKVYTKRLGDTGAPNEAYDGSGKPGDLTTELSGLALDQDYEIYLTALNPYESDYSAPLALRAAARPDAPGAITEIAASRTGSSIGLQWTAPTTVGGGAWPISGGTPILAYTLVLVIENQPDIVVYYGTSLSTTVTGL